MNSYELILLTDYENKESINNLNILINKLKELSIKINGIRISEKKKLGYQIKNKTTINLIILKIELIISQINDIKNLLKNDHYIIRYLIKRI